LPQTVRKTYEKISKNILMDLKVERINNKLPLVVAQIEPPQDGNGGDYFYRTHAPGIAMAQKKGVFVVNVTNVHRKKDHIMQEADVLVLKNICDPDILPLIRERKSQQKLTVYEIADDLSSLQPWNPVYFFYKNKENLSLVYRLASSCDALQVTVHELKRLYGHLNKHCKVFPNQILNIPPDNIMKKSNEKVIGWGGSHGHLEDLAEIAEPLSNWVMNQPNVILHLMCSDPIWKLFESLPSHKKRHTPPGSIEEYYNFLTKIHIGIAPLKNTAFNRSRSDVKYLEYAASGVVPVLAHMEPYLNSVSNGKTGFLYKDSLEFIDILNRLIENASLSHRIAKSAREYVMKERCQQKHAENRIDFYLELLKLMNTGKHRNGRGVQCLKEWAKLEGTVAKKRHFRLLPTHFEDFLHDGLVTMQLTGNKKKAHRFFQKAMMLEPRNYLPFLFGSLVFENPVDSLLKAIKLKPDSLKAWILLGEEWTRRGNIIKALHSFESALNIYPDYDIPYLRAADLLNKIGKKTEADSLFEKARKLEIHHKV
jgi:tetratricopeptide (TPR) repeat protein